MRLEASGYRLLRGWVTVYVKAIGDYGEVLFADSVALGSATARRNFVRELKSRLDGSGPDETDLERELLKLLTHIEAELAVNPQPTAPAVAPDEERVENYIKSGGGFFETKTRETAGGPVEYRVQLSNFTAEIVEDVTIDDGVEPRREFGITGTLAGRPLPLARVPADGFAAMAWVPRLWGVPARVAPGSGRRDVLRDAIQAFSTQAAQRTVYAHAGWRHLPEHGWSFLHARGALGRAGTVPGVETALPS